MASLGWHYDAPHIALCYGASPVVIVVVVIIDCGGWAVAGEGMGRAGVNSAQTLWYPGMAPIGAFYGHSGHFCRNGRGS